jgi:hypothetical protein
MNNKLKTLLKTTAAVATLMAGSQSWAADLKNIATDATATAGVATAASAATFFTTNQASGNVTTTGAFTVGSGGTAVFLVGHDGTAVRTLTFGVDDLDLSSDATLYFYNPAPATPANMDLGTNASITAASASNTGINFNIYGGISLPDLSTFSGIGLNLRQSGTVLGAAAGFGGPIYIASGNTLTQNTWAACGGLSGAGTLTAGDHDLTVNGNVSGTLTLTLSGMTTSGRKLIVTGNFETDKSFTSVPGAGTDGLSVIRGNMVLSGATSDLTTAGGVDIYGNLSVGQNTSVATGTSLHVGGNAVFTGTFGVVGSGAALIDGTATFTGAVSATSGVLSVRGATVLTGALTLADACNLSL